MSYRRLYVCLYPINVKTVEPIGLKFFVGPRETPGKVYERSNFLKFAVTKLDFWKFWKSTKLFFYKICEIFVCFTMYTKRTCSQLKYKMGAKRPKSLERRAQSALNLYYVKTLVVCLFVCIQSGPIFFVGIRPTPGKFYEWSNFQKFASMKVWFLKILKIHEFFVSKIRAQREHVHN